MDERWMPIVGFENAYEVSDIGRVRSLKRNKIITPEVTAKGYLRVSLYADGRCRHKKVHRLVLSAFDGVSDLQVDHRDDDKANNRLDNLRYCTPRQNNCWMQESKTNRTSSHLGVCWHKRKSKWIASIRIDGRLRHLGYFQDELAAAAAYENALDKLTKGGN